MSQRLYLVLVITVSAVAMVALYAWFQANQALEQSRARVVSELLEPAAALLKENEVLIKELQAAPYREAEAGILSSYLARIRRDGVAKHAAMKQRIDQLTANNIAIAALAQAHLSGARHPQFRREAEKFSNYATAWRDRWNSIMEIFMAGGDFAATEIQFPPAFAAAVQAEIESIR